MQIEFNVPYVISLLSLFSAVGAVLYKIHNLVLRFEKLEKRAEFRREDTEIMLSALQACLDGLQQTGANHNVTEMDNRLQKYIIRRR